MKTTSTPRDLLLRRHRNVETRLDALREAALRRLPAPVTSPGSPSGWQVVARELFWPARMAWAVIGIVGLCALGLDQMVSRSEPTQGEDPIRTPRTRTAAEEVSRLRRLQDAQLAQYLDERLTPPPPAHMPPAPVPDSQTPATPHRQGSALANNVWVAGVDPGHRPIS